MAVESCRVSYRIVRIRNIWSGARNRFVNVTGKLHARFTAEQKVCLIRSIAWKANAAHRATTTAM